MIKHIPFPDIKQFREAIHNIKHHSRYIGKDANGDSIYDGLKPLPILDFIGTVKLHGSNVSICWNKTNNEFWFQSRERIITSDDDNYGFAREYSTDLDKTKSLFNPLVGNEICIYGERAGKGVQKGVAIAELPKMFVIFAIRIDGIWQNKDVISSIRNKELNVYNIYDYKTYNITVDFNMPEISQNKFIEIVNEIEKECPVSKAFGINGIGEGCVWVPADSNYNNTDYWFKTKGEKHQNSKVKTLVPIDIEKVNNEREFVSNVVTDIRCKQSISKLKEANKPLTRQSLGDFIRWIYNDVIKEESDTAKSNNIEIDKIGGLVANAAKNWFFKNENNLE